LSDVYDHIYVNVLARAVRLEEVEVTEQLHPFEHGEIAHQLFVLRRKWLCGVARAGGRLLLLSGIGA
jgi:hypothetical protein